MTSEKKSLCTSILKRLLKHDDEKYIKIVSKDTQLIDMLLNITNNQVRIHTYKWKIIRRFMSLYVKIFLECKHHVTGTRYDDRSGLPRIILEGSDPFTFHHALR